MFYYQNNIWLDMMYLFLSLWWHSGSFSRKAHYPVHCHAHTYDDSELLHQLHDSCFHNDFHGSLLLALPQGRKYKDVPCRFVIGSLLGALLSAVVWIPCFLQFLSSGRSKSVIQQIETASFITNYYTTFCLLLSTASVIVIVAVFLLDGKNAASVLTPTL